MFTSKYLDIYLDLTDKIEAGTFPKGSLLPSEHQLIEEYHCSRNTIRRAIQKLADNSYVQSVQGKGVIVLRTVKLPSEFGIDRIGSLREIAERNGVTYSTKILSFEEDSINREQSRITGFALGTPVWVIRRVRYFDGEAMIIDTNWLDKNIVPAFSPTLAEKSLFDYLEKDLGINIMTSFRKFSLDKCTREDAKYLLLGDYNCLALVCCRAFNSEGNQFVYTESRHRPDRFVFYTQAKRDT